MRLLVGIGDENLAHDPPILPARSPSATPCALEHRVPMRGDVARAHVEAERHETVLAGELERLRAWIKTGDSDRRMRLLQRPQMMAQRAQHRSRHVDAPELALVFEAAVAFPDLEHDLERFAGHVAVDALQTVDAEQLPVARQAARADAQHVAALREMVHVSDAAGKFGRMVIW